MAQGDHADGTTVTPLHATWTVLPDGSPNPSVGVVFQAVRPSGRTETINTEVALEPGEASQPWATVAAAVFKRAMAAEGLDTLTPPPAEEAEPEPAAEA